MSEADEHSGPHLSGDVLSHTLAAAVMGRVSLTKLVCPSGSASSIRVDRIVLGSATVASVDIHRVHTALDTGNVTLEDARAVVSLAINFSYGIHVRLPGPIPDINIDDDIRIGTIRFPFEIGDVRIPALSNVDLMIPSAGLEDVQASVDPVRQLDLGGARFSALQLDGTVLPAAGFGLGGLSLGPVRIRDVGIPAISSAHLAVGELSPDNPLVLPSIGVRNIGLPAVSAPRVESESPVVIPGVRSQTREIPLVRSGILRASITIEPTLTIAIRTLVIRDISAASTIDRIDVRDLSAPVTLSGVSLDGLMLNDVELESIATQG